MICNLNSLAFKNYGAIGSERPSGTSARVIPSHREVLRADRSTCPVYRAAADTWIYCGSGVAVLSVSQDNEDYQHFYLDKSLCVREGVCFCITPFQQEHVSVEIAADRPPLSLDRTLIPGDLLLRRQLQVNAIYTFFYHEKEQGFFFPGEAHHMLELTYVDQGTLHSVADGQDILLRQGEMLLYGPDQWHMQYADIDVAPRYLTISFDLNGYNISSLFNRRFTLSQNAVSILRQMLREQEQMDNFSTDMLISLLTMLLLNVLRNDDYPPEKLAQSNSLHAENEIIRSAQQFISSHVRDKLSVPYVAQMVNISPSYLTALFHKHMQISPGEYIRRIKLQESKQMIRENSMNFSEIAAALQYSTVHHFSRQFKEKFGITPTEYAKSVR